MREQTTSIDADNEARNRRRLRIAVVARRVPVPIFTGINLVIHNLAMRLARRHQVKMFVTDDDDSRAGGLPLAVSA